MLPIIPIYESRKTGYKSIALHEICSKENKLTLNFDSRTGFDEIKISDVMSELNI